MEEQEKKVKHLSMLTVPSIHTFKNITFFHCFLISQFHLTKDKDALKGENYMKGTSWLF